MRIAAGISNALGLELALGLAGKAIEPGLKLRQQRRRQRRLDRQLAQHPDIGQPHAIGREHAGERMQEDGGHAQRIGHPAGMLPARPAEAAERILRHVMAALDGDLLDGIGHVLHRDREEPLGDLLGRAALAELAGQRREFFAHRRGIDGLVGLGPEDMGEEIRLDAPQHDIAIGDGERPAAAIAGRPRIGAGGIRPDAKARPVVMQDRAAARRHRMDPHHGRAHAHARDLGLEGALEIAVVMRDVGGGAAHVEADDLGEPRLARRLHRADHAAGRAGEDAVLALEARRIGEPAVGLHEHEPRPRAAARPRPERHSGAGSARDRRRPRWCRRARHVSSAGLPHG